ncbi:MAG TPA: hypothetical protein VI298_16425 [Geobacteraceae bacterium]
MQLGKTFLQAMIVSSLFLCISSARAAADHRAPPGSGEVATYELSPAAAYYEGCVGACKCPVKMAGMKGSFRLSRLAPEGSAIRWRLDDLSWAVVAPGGGVLHRISGTGTYRIDNTSGMHRLVLDIRMDDREEVRLDSGDVPGGARFPAISIPVDQGAACRDVWMDIDARPYPRKDQALRGSMPRPYISPVSSCSR